MSTNKIKIQSIIADIASEKISALCWTAHQCHGAIGFTWEHDLHLYTRRALAWKTDYGDANFHKSNLADAMGL